ncbi:hypothetical protein HNY73_003759 [Argiope bruennichi]|uniref:Uncharacterized protein n=1 Tax=Argiope bruennichi TaxID=94029 RepID=A0A8T0FP50_ARGBR|nr:hypothetical protein HNY73_003759 [Argiope bruennichi]
MLRYSKEEKKFFGRKEGREGGGGGILPSTNFPTAARAINNQPIPSESTADGAAPCPPRQNFIACDFPIPAPTPTKAGGQPSEMPGGVGGDASRRATAANGFAHL